MNRFRMVSLRESLDLPGSDLIQRVNGQRARPLLEEQLRGVASGQALVLDFAGVGVMDASFANVAIVSLAIDVAAGRYGDRFLVLTGVNDDTRQNIEAAIERRASMEQQRVQLLVRDGATSDIIGHIEPNLVVAWRLARELGELAARTLADCLQLEISTASMRLRKLYDARLLARTEEVSAIGRQHLYHVPA